MEFLRTKESFAMNSTHLIGQIHPPFKDKTIAHVEKTAQENERP